MENLTVTLIQTALHWEGPEANRAMLEEKIWTIDQPTDVIVLPEMFTTGFTRNAAPLAEVANTSTAKWMQQMADKTGALILGSVIIKEADKFYNRLIWMEPGGASRSYDKRHLFRMANEHTTYHSGNQQWVGRWKGWKIRPLVCYDLRFPVWSRNRWAADSKSMDYDLLVYVANWPQPRIGAWDTLLRARAIENLSYVVGVNRTGADGLGTLYNGHSAAIDPRGNALWVGGENEDIHSIQLDAKLLHEHRTRFPAYLDADDFTLGA